VKGIKGTPSISAENVPAVSSLIPV